MLLPTLVLVIIFLLIITLLVQSGQRKFTYLKQKINSLEDQVEKLTAKVAENRLLIETNTENIKTKLKEEKI